MDGFFLNNGAVFIPYDELEPELQRRVNAADENRRLKCACDGYGLDVLVNDSDLSVRCAVAKQGYGFDRLVNDPEMMVRLTIARQGERAETLARDPAWQVREAVAQKGMAIETLVSDPCWNVRLAAVSHCTAADDLDRLAADEAWQVRKAVAERRYKLLQLSRDGTSFVRETVAEQGYALRQLRKDRSPFVRQTAEQYLAAHPDALARKGNRKNLPPVVTVVALETADMENERICALGITQIIDGELQPAWESLVNPGCTICERNRNANHLTDGQVADAPELAALWEEIKPCFEGCLLVGHAVDFRVNALTKHLRSCGIEFPVLPRFDVAEAFRATGQYVQHDLAELCEETNTELHHHRAGSDSRSVAELLLFLAENGCFDEALIHG